MSELKRVDGYSDFVQGDFDTLYILLAEAQLQYTYSDFDEAKKLLNTYITEAEKVVKENPNIQFFTFYDDVQYWCLKKKIDWPSNAVCINFNLDEAYHLLAMIALRENNYSLAKDYFDKGLKYNPMSVAILLGYAEMYRRQHDLENVYDAVKKAYDFIYEPSFLSQYYCYLGFYYTEKKEYDIGYSCYAFSLYYDDNPIAHGEIYHIQNLLHNPSYQKNMEEILSFLRNENIPISISQSNLQQLRELLSDNNLFKMTPNLKKKVGEKVSFFSKEITSSTQIKHLSVSKPKLLYDDMIDESKMILDDMDKKRMQKNFDILRQMKLSFDEHLKIFPFNSCTKLHSKEDIVNRLLISYTMVRLILQIGTDKKDMNSSFLESMEKRFHLHSFLVPEDEKAIDNLKNGITTFSEQLYLLLLDQCAVFLWMLGLDEMPSLLEHISISVLDDLFSPISTYEELLSICHLKSKEEILQQADLLCRLNQICRDMKRQGKKLTQFNEEIAKNYFIALRWSLDWGVENIMKDHVSIHYERDDFDFTFSISNQIKVSNVTNARDYKLIFSLAKNKEEEFAFLYDIALLSDIFVDAFIGNNIRSYEEKGWKVVGIYYLTLASDGSKIQQVIFSKNAKNMETVGFCLYYFILNDHLVVLDVTLDEGIDYSDDISIRNSQNNLFAVDVLFSISSNSINQNQTVDSVIKTISDDQKQSNILERNMNSEFIDSNENLLIHHEYDYSNIVPRVDAITYLVQYCDNIYNQFLTLIEEDKKRNESLKFEFKNYQYKRSYREIFEVHIRNKDYHYISCKDFTMFQSAINQGDLKNVNSLEIRLCLDYKRGREGNLISFENSFVVSFKPYQIMFVRKSNHNEEQMMKIEDDIKKILDQFPVENTIFCTK